MFKKLLSLALAVLMIAGCVAVFSSCSKKNAETTYAPVAKEDLKIGLICLHDENSTYDKNFIDAMNRAKTALGLTDAQVIIKTNIPESDDAYKAAVELVDAGCQLIFADSFGHEDFLMKAAAKYPSVQFCHATGTKAHTSYLGNYHNAFASIYEGRYAAGVIGGIKLAQLVSENKITDANKTSDGAIKIGYVGAFPYAEVISGYTSYYLGVQYGYKAACESANVANAPEKVVMSVKYTNSWYDQGAEGEAAKALIADGCALISQHADSMGAPSACEEKNVPNVSYNGSTKAACPNTYLVSSYIDWSAYYEVAANAVMAGTRVPEDFCGGTAEGSVKLAELNEAAFSAKFLEMAQEIVADLEYISTLNIFDCETFTVNGKHLTEYMADVNTDANYTSDTQVIKVEKDGDGKVVSAYFQESTFRSAPYFDIIIDGITVPKQN